MPKTKRFKSTRKSCPTSDDPPQLSSHACSEPLPRMASDPPSAQHVVSDPAPAQHVASDPAPAQHVEIHGEPSQERVVAPPPPRGHWRVIVIGMCP